MASIETRGVRQLGKALGWSLSGLRAAFVHEASFRLEVYLSVFLLPLALWLGSGPIEKILLAGSVLLVLIVELLNSAVETTLDRIGPEFHTLAGRAKDIGSAAVLLTMLLALMTWALILWPQI